MIEHEQEHGQLINKASGGRPLSEIWHISYFNVSGYAAILFYAFWSLRYAVMVSSVVVTRGTEAANTKSSARDRHILSMLPIHLRYSFPYRRTGL